MRCTRIDASRASEVRAIAARCADTLTARLGVGYWSKVTTLQTQKKYCEEKEVYLCSHYNDVVSTFTLQPVKPFFISAKLFTESDSSYMWMTDLFVDVPYQGSGFGARTLDEARRIVRSHSAAWVRFDAYSADPVSLRFYEQYGAVDLGGTTVNGVDLRVLEIPARRRPNWELPAS